MYWMSDSVEVKYETAEAAMAAFAKRGFPVDVTIVDGSKATAAAPTIGHATMTRTVEQAASEQATMMTALAAAGLKPPPPLFAPGTEMIAAGKDKYRSLALAWEAMQPADEAFNSAADHIQRENRRDIVLDASTLKMDVRKGADGKPLNVLTRDGTNYVTIEPLALKGLVSRASDVFPRGYALMEALDPEIRAEVWNKQIVKYERMQRDSGKRQIKVRLRKLNGTPSAFAVVGPAYASADADTLLRMYAEELKGSGARASVEYSPASTNTIGRYSWHAPVEYDAHVGDVFRGGGVWRTNDAGNGSHRLSLAFTRIMCINCTIAEFAADVGRRVHRGEAEDFRARVRDDIKSTLAAGEPFFASWKKMRETPIEALRFIRKATKEEREAGSEDADRLITDPKMILEGMVLAGQINRDVARDALVESLLAAFDEEPGEDLASIANAITRAAHSGPFDLDERLALERSAGDLIPLLIETAASPKYKALALPLPGTDGEVEVIESK